MFVKGQSGNPGGRPKKSDEELEFIQACRGKTMDAFRTIVGLMDGAEKEATRLNAATYLIERAYGKAPEKIELTGPDGEPIEEKRELIITIIEPGHKAVE